MWCNFYTIQMIKIFDNTIRIFTTQINNLYDTDMEIYKIQIEHSKSRKLYTTIKNRTI